VSLSRVPALRLNRTRVASGRCDRERVVTITIAIIVAIVAIAAIAAIGGITAIGGIGGIGGIGAGGVGAAGWLYHGGAPRVREGAGWRS